jgi:hypothetical protein
MMATACLRRSLGRTVATPGSVELHVMLASRTEFPMASRASAWTSTESPMSKEMESREASTDAMR